MHILSEAIQHMENNNYEKAIQLLDQQLENALDEEKFTIAEIYKQWGFLQKAQPILQELVAAYPEESELKTELANIYIELEDDEAAINLLNDIHEGDSFYVQALMQLADLYEAQGLYEVAETKLLSAKQQMPHEPIIDFALGELFFSIGDYARAINYYERLMPHMETVGEVSISARLAEAYAGTGQYEVALNFYEDVKSDDPDVIFKHGLTAFYSDQNNVAIHQWKRLMKHDKYYHTVYYYLAKAYENEGLIEEAYDVSMAGLEVDEFNKELYYFSSRLARQLGKYDKSEELVRQAVLLDPDYKEAVIFLIECLKETNRDGAIVELIQEVQTLGANDPLYDWELARAYEALESYKDALKLYQQAYNQLKHDSDFLKEYAYFLIEEGKIDEGLHIFEDYLKLEPLDYETEEYVERLKLHSEI